MITSAISAVKFGLKTQIKSKRMSVKMMMWSHIARLLSRRTKNPHFQSTNVTLHPISSSNNPSLKGQQNDSKCGFIHLFEAVRVRHNQAHPHMKGCLVL